jgi:CheY-like chemotaxis protein
MKETVLCIDDDPTALGIQSMLLKVTNFCKETLTRQNGLEALHYYETLPAQVSPSIPSVLFLDLNMPIMDGWSFLEEFQRDYINLYPETKVYILSSSVDPEDQIRSKSYPFVKAFLSKPITKEILKQILREEL